MSNYIQVSTSDCDIFNNPDITENVVQEDHEPVYSETTTKYKLYKKRWLIISIFILYSFTSYVQWIQYSIIANILVKYYNISNDTVNWTALIYFLAYSINIFPSSYVVNRLGLRPCLILGVLGTCIGSWVKVASVEPNRFWVIIVGQTIVAISHIFTIPIIPKLATTWFSSDEVSLVSNIGVFGSQLGIAAGFLLPTLLLNGNEVTENTERCFLIIAIGIAILSSVTLLLALLFFSSEPLTRPSPLLQLQEARMQSLKLSESFKELFTNPAYVLLLIVYGIILGVFNSILVLLNQIVTEYYHGDWNHAGIIGCLMILAGVLSSLIGVIILNKFNKIQLIITTAYTITILLLLAFIFVLETEIAYVYVILLLLSISMNSFRNPALEGAAELTYPVPESISESLLTISSNIFGILFTYLYSFLFFQLAPIWANIAILCVVTFGLMLMTCIEFDFRKRAAQKAKYSDIVEFIN